MSHGHGGVIVCLSFQSILRAALKTLWAKLKGHKEARALFEETAQHIKIQAQQTERQIKAEFEKLHRFLREEEEARLAALRREKEQKSQMMKKRIETIMTEMSSALDTIRTIKDQLECDNVMFLHSYKTTVKRTWSSLQDAHHPSGVLSSLVTQLTHLVGSTFSKPGQIHVDTVRRISSTPQEPKLTEGALIDVAKHLGNLKYKVWEKMAASVQYTPVTLDPNTAARCLSLSEDLTSVRYTAERQSLPDNLERFAVGAEVLGSEGFNSGQHQWEVIVGDNHNWAVGMARESVKRKEKTTLSAEEGILALRFCGGEYTAEKAPLPVPKKPQRIRVQLNWNWGEVNFSDPAHNHHIGTIAFKGSEKLFPYFYSVCKDHPLQIAPEQLNITVEAPKQGMLSFLSGVLKY
ncbi:hypothetical protein MATL_G00001710 [Megalops atlanticus]|uniref:B30.2/SPRY domain-containing protein n=1 Tax=Megalops atlanticus TaxID=7932 RepID=A0A9D3QEJ0_MEGAT|nr:hypothetical protein MATL_G00001710 [Megalops atlanticus]